MLAFVIGSEKVSVVEIRKWESWDELWQYVLSSTIYSAVSSTVSLLSFGVSDRFQLCFDWTEGISLYRLLNGITVANFTVVKDTFAAEKGSAKAFNTRVEQLLWTNAGLTSLCFVFCDFTIIPKLQDPTLPWQALKIPKGELNWQSRLLWQCCIDGISVIYGVSSS